LELKGESRSRGVTGEVSFSAEESLDELAVLTESAGAMVADREFQIRERAEAATLIGSGKLEELKGKVAFHDATLVVFDRELSPTQLRNLERTLDVKVLDRTQLILDIFASRARTREGQLQVELAQLNYLLPRLAGRGSMMSRLGGGIGTRGPGETQLETDRRKIYRRIKTIERELEKVRSGRSIQRRQRQGVPLETIALVGYTNAGKSTLFNRLTGADVTADARMFATLDPTVRHAVLPSKRKVLFSDTVGFIRNLPTTLVKAFRATLEEVMEATLLLHVVDASSPHASQYTEHVASVLAEIGVTETPEILVLNKLDLIPETDGGTEAMVQRILGETTHSDGSGPKPARALAASARTGAGIEQLMTTIDEFLAMDPVKPAVFRFPAAEGGVLHLLHQRSRVESVKYDGDTCEVEAVAPESLRRQLAQYVS
jgi:GTP-binding protein HflX